MIIQRSIKRRLLRELRTRPAVYLGGPRQAGKTTLVQEIARENEGAGYFTFDDITTRGAALNDPEGFLRSSQGLAILDEVQLAPDVYRAVKLLIDERRAIANERAFGSYLLTGSASAMALPTLSDALVGRMSILTLLPLSAAEAIGQHKPVINGLLDQDIGRKKIEQREKHRLDIGRIFARAGFPELAANPSTDRHTWFDGYLNSLIQRDVRELAQIDKLASLPVLVQLLALRAGALLNDADCARDAGLSLSTYRRYRALLEAVFLTVRVPPWFRNIGKRLVKSPKLYFTDTALLCHVLNADPNSLRQANPALFGRIVENFVATELMKQLSLFSGAALYHFRTHDGREVDFVIERRNGEICGIEVKSRDHVESRDFDGLRALKDAAGEKFARGIVFYLGSNITPFGGDMFAVPLDLLWKLNMTVTTDKDIRCSDKLNGSVLFWAKYGERTRIRCIVERETIEDYFHDGASDAQSVAAIERQWETIWPIFVQKIEEGRIEKILHDNGPGIITGRYQIILQATLQPADFGECDFRQNSAA